MNRGFGFMLAVPIVLIGILTLLVANNVAEEQKAFEEYCLSYAVDYAVDAATEELLGDSNLGLDYQDWGRVKVNPERALEVFQEVMLINYGYPLTDKAREDITINHVPIFCVAAYDGYYVYEQHKVGNYWVLTSTPKIPYSYRVGSRVYALNLGFENCLKFDGSTISKVQVSSIGLDREDVLFQINSKVSDDLMSRYRDYEIRNTSEHELRDAMVYIPAGLTTMTQVNAIEGPSVIAIVDNWDRGTINELDSFSIGGARIESTRQVACYIEGGVKWYAYADLLPAGVSVEHMVSSPKEAAELGYHYDYNLMG